MDSLKKYLPMKYLPIWIILFIGIICVIFVAVIKSPGPGELYISRAEHFYTYKKMGDYIYRGEWDALRWQWEIVAPAYRIVVDTSLTSLNGTTVTFDTIRYVVTHLMVTDTLVLEGRPQ